MLFHKIKPVFVFDGATPELKRHTVASRRRQHDNAEVRLHRAAEKLLTNKLLAYALQQAQSQQLKQQTDLQVSEPRDGIRGSVTASDVVRW
jgi:DNA excision repair protein ERCC-5